MTNAKKNLKLMSIVILALAAFTLIRLGVSVFAIDFGGADLPQGATSGAVLAAQIGVLVFSFLLLLPQIYVGVKGMKIAEKPDRSKTHIVWATVLAVLSVIALISPVMNLIQVGNLAGNFVELFDLVTDAAVYIAYIAYAKQVLKAA